MRNLILAAAMTLGLGLVPGSLAAAPAASLPVPLTSMAEQTMPDIELAQTRGNAGPGGGYYGPRSGYYGPRNRYRGRGYGYRRSYGPPPRVYGRGYYRRDRQWDRTW
ncbi:MAG: hypothetical protein Q8R85_01195 [Bosea sp. (in: a-proteobacteria)]|uniref:hypothetical protein n=1 Tax=Bosea sp. (in: a-proteobacteria) TaxID=1871050 RepID=UPI0027324FC2|nr:hypothetical protein [Bosea sp. (in: a-proteobacteria)]MDP3599767.1 hypothetical protein [Bosea sp. (in: a-proteobacteria)]